MWREQRRFALQVLRDFGLGKNLMQERVDFLFIQSVIEKMKQKIPLVSLCVFFFSSKNIRESKRNFLLHSLGHSVF